MDAIDLRQRLARALSEHNDLLKLGSYAGAAEALLPIIQQHVESETVELREQNERFASRLGGYATTMQTQLDPLFQMLGKLRALVEDWQANSGSRALSDPTAATWNDAALQLLRVLDGKDPGCG